MLAPSLGRREGSLIRQNNVHEVRPRANLTHPHANDENAVISTNTQPVDVPAESGLVFAFAFFAVANGSVAASLLIGQQAVGDAQKYRCN